MKNILENEMSNPHASAPAEDVSDTPLTDALLDQFAAYYLICVLGMEMLEEARRQRAIAERSAS
ncbi:MAG: hypothetical protein VXY12_07615 [Pseudomonadota bacterium]|nr:hypothetical protein [Pseudomonadota bacterium]